MDHNFVILDKERPMSQTKVSKLLIRSTKPGEVSTGANTEVLLDGQKIPASFVKIEFKAKKLTKVMIELYCEVELEVDTELEQTHDQGEFMRGNKHYQLGKLSSVE